jgi:hypothetical protein
VLARAGLVGALLSLLIVANASAVTRVWDGGCGVDTKWSCAANWSEDVDPDKEDVALFNSTSTSNSTVDSEFEGTVAALRINPGYTGTISLSRGLQVLGLFKQVAGSFTAGAKSLNVKTFNLTGGSFTASSGTTAIKGTMKIAGTPTFNANGGTVEFYGGGTLICDGVSFSSVVFTHISGTRKVGASCTLPLGKDPILGSVGAALALNGTLSGSGTITTFKKLTLGEAGSLAGFSGLDANAVIVDGSYDFGEYEPFTTSGDLTLSPSAEVVAPGGIATLGRGLAIVGGASFDANEGTLKFVGKSPYALACGEQALNFVVFEGVGRQTIGSDCTVPLGANPNLGKGGMVLNGTLSGSGTLTETGLIEIGSEDPGLESFTNVVDSGSLTLKPAASVTAPPGTLTVKGNLTIAEGASFDANEGTVDFEAPYRTSRSLSCGGVTFDKVLLANKGRQIVGEDCMLPLGEDPEIGKNGQIELNGAFTGTGTLTADSALFILGETGSLSGFSGFDSGALAVAGAYDFGEYEPFAVGGDFSIAASGEFVAPETTAAFAADFSNSGSFEANEGTVELTGTGQAVNGSTIFENLSKVVEAADTLTFQAGATQTVKGMLTLEGASTEALLALVSSKAGEAWNLAGAGSRTAKWLSVKDSNNTGIEVEAVESVDVGGNTGWSF